jgi:hypothetical protein
VREHVLLRWASQLQDSDRLLRARLNQGIFERILEQVPDAWLLPEPGAGTPDEKRAGYLQYLTARLEAAAAFVEEAERARTKLI